MNARGIGIAIGILVGLALVVVLYKMANTDHKVKTEYDERQEKIRGKAYKYAFYTVLIYQIIVTILTECGIGLHMESYAQSFIGILFGCLTLGCYCIWNDVYWGLNNDRKRYAIIFAVCLILNICPIAGAVAGGNLMEDGQIGMPILNIAVIFMMTVLLIVMLIKKVTDNSKDDGED